MSCLQEHTIDWFQGGSHNLSICLLRIDKRFNWNLMEDKIIILQRFLKDLQPHPASKKWASGEGSSSGSTFGSSSSHSPQHRRAWQIFVNNKSPTLKHEKRISLEIVCHDKYSYSSPENFIQCVVNISKGNRALPKFSVGEKSLSGHLDQSLVFLLLRCRNSEKSEMKPLYAW